jgi:hypothetical protein
MCSAASAALILGREIAESASSPDARLNRHCVGG